jgi:hypothetical protein
VTDFRDSRDEGNVRTPRGTRVTPEDTTSATWRDETTHRETMTHDLMVLGRWLSENPEAAPKNLKPVRSAKSLQPGVYYNMGTGTVDRVFTPQHVALGHQMFRVTSDPDAPVEMLRRKIMEGK